MDTDKYLDEDNWEDSLKQLIFSQLDNEDWISLELFTNQ